MSSASGTDRPPGLPRNWTATLVRLLERQPLVARVVVTAARGSTPREPGAFMLVGDDCVEGSIGGGRLEWEAIAAARSLLADPGAPALTTKVVLAADVGQCCGGVVSCWLEKFTRDDLPVLRAAAAAGARGAAVLVSEVAAGAIRRHVVSHEARPQARMATAAAVDQLLREPRQRAAPVVLAATPHTLTFLERLDDDLPAVWLYGAGHVGQALARILTELPLRLTWVDSRAALFPNNLHDGVRVLQDPDPVVTVSEAPVGAYFIVMSHSHPLDFDLCHALLERNDFAWLGLIGSDSKAARFRSRLARTGLGPEVVEKLVCPIGVEGITSKWPAAIAVAVAAQLMQRISSAAERGEPHHPAPAPVSSARCGPELCATCGSAVASPSTNTTPSSHPDTVHS
jgi:xanthine dehydrogenase accessory factor